MQRRKNIKVIFDVNIWLSFTIGKQLSILQDVLLHRAVTVYVCEELIEEYAKVVQKPKLKKYLTQERIAETIRLMEQTTKFVKIKSKVVLSRDSKDDYLLALAKDSKADFLITGDKDLLVLNPFEHTQILTMADFLKQFAM